MSQTAEETATTAENEDKEDCSMEKLQIDEEDEKNLSAEDILGGNTLIMSDSEDDAADSAGVESTADHIQKENVETTEAYNEEEDDLVRKPRKKISAIIDSDSESDMESKEAATKQNSVRERELNDKVVLKQRKKISALIDTDSEEEAASKLVTLNSESEGELKDKVVPKQRKKISALIDTDSEQEDAPKLVTPVKKKSKKTAKKKQQIQESDDEKTSIQSECDQEPLETAMKSKLKDLVDSESDHSNVDEEMDHDQSNGAAPDKSKNAKPMRASAKQAMDTMQAIQSEQQRLHREAHISVPYHQPKPRTLKEFLNRRTINQPLETALAGGSPMPLKREPRRSMAVRMNSEELQAYAKLMEERAKEATEFFKSDSEQDDDDDRDKEDIDKPAVQLAVIEDEKEPEPPALTMKEVEELLGTGTEPEQESLPSALVEGSPIKASLVTEVVELPRLDLSTLAASPSVKPATPRISEAIRRLKDEVGTDASPSLRGDANMVIDLETGDMFAKKPTGVDDLLQRLMKTREAKKHKTTETVNILSTSHGKLELSKITRQLHDEEPVQKEQKPGAAYLKLQEQLKALINKKRMEDMRKKQAEEMEEEEEVDDMDIDEEYEPDAKPGKKEFAVNEDEEIVDELPEETAEEEEPDADKETEDTGEDEQEKEVEADNDSSSSSESEPEEQVEGKRKNRIIRAFEDDNSDEELLQTPKPGTTAPVTATQLQLSDQNLLFDAESQRTPSDDENELLGLCSGKFSGTQGTTEAPTVGAIISQIPITQAEPASQMPDELEALCSGVFETQKPELEIELASNKILSSDEEQQAEKPRQKKLAKKRQKKKAKLGFSDDEESVDEEEDEELSAGELEPVEDVPETFVDYDSEENEILVEMTKKDRKMRAANFVEKEAELSESEWGSADEDEKNMDTYDMELGDEDQFDREKLQHELGQIHARKMLDQDIRDVRKIKEMLFEDDEGAVRQRQFRWKNADNAGFSLDDQGTNLADGEANEGSGDEENEHLWRKVRFEREQLLLEKGLKAEAANSPLPLSPAVGNTSIGAVRKMTIIRTKTTNVELKKNSPFLISKNVSNVQQQQRAVRGSFLVRDKDTLNKLAGMTKGAAGDVDGAAGTVSKAKAKNFVFATLTEEEHENQKRKAADLLNSSSETGINFMKKPRLEPRREKCLIDQLL